jgi:hypothetical protein
VASSLLCTFQHKWFFCVHISKLTESDYPFCHVYQSVGISFRLSAGTEHFGSYYSDYNKILYLTIYLKSVEKIQVPLTSERNKGYFTERRLYVCNIPLNSFRITKDS